MEYTCTFPSLTGVGWVEEPFLFSILSLYVGAGIEQASVNIFIYIDAHHKLKSDSFKFSCFILKGVGKKKRRQCVHISKLTAATSKYMILLSHVFNSPH